MICCASCKPLGLQMGLILFSLLPPPVISSFLILQYSSLSPHPLVLSLWLLSCSAVLAIPGELCSPWHIPPPRLLVPTAEICHSTGPSWVPAGPWPSPSRSRSCAIYAASVELLMQGSAWVWQIFAASSPFGHNFVVFHNPISTTDLSSLCPSTFPSLEAESLPKELYVLHPRCFWALFLSGFT